MREVVSVGSTLVSSCRCCVLVSCIHPVAILRAVFCTIYSLSMFVLDALGDHMVEAYSSTGLVYGFVCGEYGFLVFAPLGRGEDFEYVDSFACFVCYQVHVSVVGEFGVKCES